MGDALDQLNTAIAHEDKRTSNDNNNNNNKKWRNRLTQARKTPFDMINTIMKPMQPTNFTANEMRQQWIQTWCPDDYDDDKLAEAWNNHADTAQLQPLPNNNDPNVLPNYDDFHGVLLQAKGGPGWDGWTAHEVQTIGRHMPRATEELHQLWLDTTTAAPLADANHADAPTIAYLYDDLYRTRTVGLPKTDTDSRPISIFSGLVRCWHRALLKLLPQPPPDQWAGKPGISVATATAHWLATDKTHGAELDLSRAFDTISHEVANFALQRSGVPTTIRSLLRLSWRAERICTVRSKPALPIRPSRGIPQGCPASPLILACVLRPWSAILKKAVPAALTWLYMDDRSIAISPTTTNDPQSDLDIAIHTTNEFDKSIGVEENVSKRQLWGPGNATTVEHLGTTTEPLNANAATQPRKGFTRALDKIKELSHVPGGFSLRLKTALYYIRPLFTWCAPLHYQPPAEIVDAMYNGLTQIRTTWWCKRRFWCDNLIVHPAFASTTQALKAIKPLNHDGPQLGEHLENSINHHLSYLSLQWTLTSADHGIAAELPTTADTLLRERLHDHNAKLPDDQRLPDNVFWTASKFGQHVLRYLMRRTLLNNIPTTRNDSEGHRQIDLDAQSHGAWNKWRNKLSHQERSLLTIWRAGASWTPTRRYRDIANATCPYCQHPLASTRHFWSECPAFDTERHNLNTLHSIPADWWAQQPRVTAKTGWITYDAGGDVATRAHRQVAANKLGMAILRRISRTFNH